MFVGLVQLAVVLHVRNTLISCATEGARHAALADVAPAAGVERARRLVIADLGPAYADSIEASSESVAGMETVVVRIRAPLPVIGLLGAGRSVAVSGHAVREGP